MWSFLLTLSIWKSFKSQKKKIRDCSSTKKFRLLTIQTSSPLQVVMEAVMQAVHKIQGLSQLFRSQYNLNYRWQRAPKISNSQSLDWSSQGLKKESPYQVYYKSHPFLSSKEYLKPKRYQLMKRPKTTYPTTRTLARTSPSRSKCISTISVTASKSQHQRLRQTAPPFPE